MRKYLAAVLLAILLCGCNNEVQPEITETESATEIIPEAAVTTAATEEVTTEKTETTVTTTEMTTVSSETITEETTAESEETTVPLTETPYHDEVDDILKTIEQNSKTVGNDTAGYITVYADQTYEEDEDGCFTVSSEDGKSYTDVFFIEGI